MTTQLQERPHWWSLRELWASLAVSVIWVAVALAAIFGGDITSTTVGGTTSTVPSGIVVGLFAVLASWIVARIIVGRRDS
jgi:uncharacterized membrane protein (DUF485 family)